MLGRLWVLLNGSSGLQPNRAVFVRGLPLLQDGDSRGAPQPGVFTEDPGETEDIEDAAGEALEDSVSSVSEEVISEDEVSQGAVSEGEQPDSEALACNA